MKKFKIMQPCVVAVVVLAIAPAAFGAPRRSAKSTVDIQKSEAESESGQGTVTVKARGVGIDKNAALKDAYRDAVEQAVGLYVDAESEVKNDELVKDQILTHSNAYIEKYEELGTKTVDGLVQVRIAATVKKRELAASLKKGSSSQTANKAQYTGDLKDIHAQIVSKDKRDADGYKLLQNALMELDPCTLLAVPSVDMTHKQVIKEGKLGYKKNIPDGQVILRLLLRLKFNEEKYFKEFVPVVKPVLDQIASASKKVKLSLLDDSERISKSILDDYLVLTEDSARESRGSLSLQWNLLDQFPCMSPMRVLYGGGCLMGMEGFSYSLCDRFAESVGCRAVQFVSGGYSSGSGWERRNEYNHYVSSLRKGSRRAGASVGVDDLLASLSERNGPLNNQCKQQLILVCGINKAHTVWDAVFYEVDRKCAAVFMLWCDKYGSGASGSSNKDRAQANSIKYSVSYCDKGGDCVLVNAWHIPRVCIMNADWGSLGDHYFNDGNVLYISPFLGCYSEEYVQWHDALIKTDMLQEIESVKVELEN